MKCPRCQVQNEEGARFCEDCGACLELACPNCGKPVRAGRKFCRPCGAALTTEPGRSTSPQAYTPKHLAKKILTSRNALEGERKQVADDGGRPPLHSHRTQEWPILEIRGDTEK